MPCTAESGGRARLGPSAAQPRIDVTATFDPAGRIPAQVELFAEKLAALCNP
jgi:hypothetical protein